MNPTLQRWGTLAVLWVFLALAGGACTVIAFNRAPVTTSVKDSHNADSGTNGAAAHSFDINVSPR